jgi:hypothetical protein
MKPNFTQLDQAFDADDFEWLNLHAPAHLAAIERLITTGATPLQIRQYAQRRIGPERQQFVSRCEGAARYLQAQAVEA